MFIRFQNCLGLKLFRFRKWQVELWWCPRGEQLPTHSHPSMESRILFLAGSMIFTREEQTIILGAWDIFRNFRIKAGQNHSAEVVGPFGLFLNIETWTTEPTSAAHDLIRA